jgi:hypothetical protein
MLVDALAALQDWAPAVYLRHARWTYAATNAAHIAGIALLFGAVVPLDLRLIGWRRGISIRALTRALLPVAIAGFCLAVTAGFFLFSVRAVEYAGLELFWVKMALIACARTNAWLLHRAAQWEAGQGPVDDTPPPRLRVAGALSIALWLSVIVCGRMLAFVD